MISLNKKACAAMLGLALLFAVVPANAQSRYRDGRTSTQKKVAIIGGSAAAGAVIGALLGGKKGALIGGLVGGGAGTGVVLLQNRRQNDDRYGYYDRYGRYQTYGSRWDARDNRWTDDDYYRDHRRR